MITARIWAYWPIIGEMHCDKSCQGRTRRRWAKASTLREKIPALERRNLPHYMPCRRLAPLLGLANGPVRGESERLWLDSLAGSVSLHQCFFLLSNKFPCFQPSKLRPSRCQPFSISAKSRAIAGYLCQRVSFFESRKLSFLSQDGVPAAGRGHGVFWSSPWGSRRSDRHVFCICLRNSPPTG